MSIGDMMQILKNFISPYDPDCLDPSDQGRLRIIDVTAYQRSVQTGSQADFLNDILSALSDDEYEVFLTTGGEGPTPLFIVACQLALMSCVMQNRRCFRLPVSSMGIPGTSLTLRRAIWNALKHDNHLGDHSKRWSAAALLRKGVSFRTKDKPSPNMSKT